MTFSTGNHDSKYFIFSVVGDDDGSKFLVEVFTQGRQDGVAINPVYRSANLIVASLTIFFLASLSLTRHTSPCR